MSDVFSTPQELKNEKVRELVAEAHAKKEYRPGAVALVRNCSNKVLMVQSAKDGGVWHLPQGGIDEGEEADKALLRELMEEVGIKPDTVSDLRYLGWQDLDAEPTRKNRRGFSRGKRYFFFSLFTMAPPELVVNTRELRAYEWLTVYEALRRIAPQREEWRQMIQKFILHQRS